MSFDPVHIGAAIVFGLIGMAMFVYGKRQQLIVPMLGGIGLMLFPYFVSNPVAVIGVGVGIIVGVFALARML